MKISNAEMVLLAVSGFIAGAASLYTFFDVIAGERDPLQLLVSSSPALSGLLLMLLIFINVRTRSKTDADG